jgi:hypothetical protein
MIQRKKIFLIKCKSEHVKKINFLWGILNTIFLIVFNLYFFLLEGFDNSTSDWISYISIHFAYFMLLATPYLVSKSNAEADYSRPLFTISSINFFLTFIVGIFIIIISIDVFTTVLLIHVSILAFFTVLLLVNIIANEYSASNDKILKIEINYVREACQKLSVIQNMLTDKKLQKIVEKAYDSIYSSQVKSSLEVRSLELDIINEIDKLVVLIKEKKIDDIESSVNQICMLAEERNSKLKLLN